MRSDVSAAGAQKIVINVFFIAIARWCKEKLRIMLKAKFSKIGNKKS
jgi:hypothetical protein